MQSFKCQKNGHSAKECTNPTRRVHCSQDHSVKEGTIAKECARCSNCGGAHATVYQGCRAFQHKLAEASKKINDNKFSVVANKLKPHASTELTLSTEKIVVLVNEVLIKIRTVLNTMSFSDIISIVSNSASRIFTAKIDGQRIHGRIKSANAAPVISLQSNSLPNNKNFLRRMDKLNILQWNCRGLNNKLNDLILFSAEADIDVFCLNAVKNRKKSIPLNNYIVATETYNNGHRGSAVSVKNSIVIKRKAPVEKETDSNGRTLATLKFALSCPFLMSFG